MFLKAGAISLILLLASRLLGLLRESALAAAFGSSGMADAAILMLTLPDWIAGVLASGALTYVLLPHWANEAPAQRDATQRRVATWLLVLSAILLACMWGARLPLGAILVPGVAPPLRDAMGDAIAWSALALPAAMLAGLWGARLQSERDFVGLYGASLVVNFVVIAALMFMVWKGPGAVDGELLGASILLAVALRLAWQFIRLPRVRPHARAARPPDTVPAHLGVGRRLPGWRIWGWAALAAGLPLTLPFVARSLASGGGEGALTLFNYAWKLVELPLILAIQLVASLAFPAIAHAHAQRVQGTDVVNALDRDTGVAVRNALVFAWTLACAAAAALIFGAPAIATLLFGWGRMQPHALDQIAALGSVGAWGLLPQALIAVALTVLATLGRMRVVVIAYAAALCALLAAGAMGLTDGEHLMWVLNGAFVAIALAAWGALGTAVWRWVPLRALCAPLTALIIVALAVRWLGGGAGLGTFSTNAGEGLVVCMVGCAFVAVFVMAFGWFSGPHLRQALRS